MMRDIWQDLLIVFDSGLLCNVHLWKYHNIESYWLQSNNVQTLLHTRWIGKVSKYR